MVRYTFTWVKATVSAESQSLIRLAFELSGEAAIIAANQHFLALIWKNG
jgi:hypothetical protein